MGFERRAGELCVDGVPLEEIARRFGTPTYVYSAGLLAERLGALRAAFAAFSPDICYAVKACANLSVLSLFARWGTGFDIVSAGELHRVLAAGGQARRVVFAGVGKQRWELERALDAGVGRFNAESAAELERLGAVARERGVVARVALRVNPDVDPRTHEYIRTGSKENKFGVDLDRAGEVIRAARAIEGIDLCGLHCHIGSQICEAEPYLGALRRIRAFFDDFGRAGFDHLDLGGGFGIDYGDGRAMDFAALAAALEPELRAIGLPLVLEPGRSLVASAGTLLTRVIEAKPGRDRTFLIVDAGMNDLLRPSLYKAAHRIEEVRPSAAPVQRAQVVGPICESGDFLCEARDLPLSPAGALLAVRDCGAYGFAMSSQYNARPRAAEVLVGDGVARLARRRESFDDLLRGELASDLLDG
ncbi:MAG: diaminopimelate decarboxylase [Planctomycetes bacterium]|nr:diaminopimelate decarboxylase [Planctomycetota bacterium]